MNDKLNKRCDECFALSMKFNGEGYIGAKSFNKDFNVHMTEIQCDSDEEWNEKIEKLKVELDKRSKGMEEISKKPDAKEFFAWVEEEYFLQTNGRWSARDRGMAASAIGVAKDWDELYKFFHAGTVFNLGLHKIL